jgi:hypothetical protein
MSKPLPRFCEICGKPLTWRLLTWKFNVLTGRPVQYLYLACPTVKGMTGDTVTGHTNYAGGELTGSTEYNVPDDLVAQINAAENKAAEEMSSTR